MIREGDRKSHFLHIKEGVTHGDPLNMIKYGLGILPLIRDLWTAHPGSTETYYGDYAGAGGTFEGILQHLDDLMLGGPPWDYFPETTKRSLVMSPRNVSHTEALFSAYGLQVVKRSRYL